MNAGLLGEHLASPRTAQKTNQSTALDPKTAQRGESSNKDEFASYVTKDSDPARPEPDVTDTSNAYPPTPENTPDPHKTQIFGARLDAAEIDAAASGEVDGAKLAAETAPVDADLPKANTPRALGLAQGIPADDATASFAQSGEAGEIVAQDPRVRGESDLRAGDRAARGQTVKSVDIAEISATAASAEPELNPTGLDAVEGARLRNQTPDAAPLPAPSTTQGLEAQASNAEATAFRQTATTDLSALDRIASGGVTRDAPAVIADTAAPLAVATSTSTPTTPTTGLTPTAPAIPLATPTELSNVILNAINNGLDPQEQLVVQLDPPELGRVMIDFKFDAQGLQQVVVTTENPEALKRLREMHFELTQALREHGLSEQNMSFREQADGQTQQDWNDSESPRQMAQLIAAEDRRASPSATPTASSSGPRDRLDLLL